MCMRSCLVHIPARADYMHVLCAALHQWLSRWYSLATAPRTAVVKQHTVSPYAAHCASTTPRPHHMDPRCYTTTPPRFITEHVSHTDIDTNATHAVAVDVDFGAMGGAAWGRGMQWSLSDTSGESVHPIRTDSLHPPYESHWRYGYGGAPQTRLTTCPIHGIHTDHPAAYLGKTQEQVTNRHNKANAANTQAALTPPRSAEPRVLCACVCVCVCVSSSLSSVTCLSLSVSR